MPDHPENLFESMSKMLASGIEPESRQEELWARYGETVAVLTLDSTGFTRVSQSHGIVHFLSRVMMLRNLCIPVLEAHRSKRHHFEADNIYAAFDSIDDCVRAAQALHRCVFEARLQLTDEERYRVSIGIGFGKLLYSQTLEGYFGDEMNIACKLGEDIATGDETLLSPAAFSNADQQLLTGFEWREVAVSGVQLPHYRHLFTP